MAIVPYGVLPPPSSSDKTEEFSVNSTFPHPAHQDEVLFDESNQLSLRKEYYHLHTEKFLSSLSKIWRLRNL